MKKNIVIGKVTEKVLNKVQKEFNRLTKRIEKLKTAFQEQKDGSDALRKRVNSDFLPLQNKYNTQLIEMMKLMDEYYGTPKSMASERKKIAHFIVTNCHSLIGNFSLDELKPLHDKYSGASFDEIDTETEAETAKQMRQMIEMMTGEKLPDDIDLSSPEKVQEYIMKRMEREEEKEEKRHKKREEARASKPKSEKQAAKEEKKQAESVSQYKSVRAVYMDLVKAFHPDLEPDEAEKMRKTAILQRVTQAYEDNDLLALLQLQLELERIDPTHLDNIADSQLTHYNKVLKNQVRELEEELDVFSSQIGMMFGLSPFEEVDLEYLQNKLESDIEDLDFEVGAITSQVGYMEDGPTYIKMYLRDYKIPKKQKKINFFDIYWGAFV